MPQPSFAGSLSTVQGCWLRRKDWLCAQQAGKGIVVAAVSPRVLG